MNIKDIINNKNIHIGFWRDDLCLEFQPYDRELDLKYIREWVNNIKVIENQILRFYNVTNFAINLSNGFNLDGLQETSNTLIFKNSIIYNHYTGDSIKLN